MDWMSIGIAVLSSGVLVAIINWIGSRSRDAAEAEASNVGTAIRLRNEVIAERDTLRQQVAELAQRVAELERALEQRGREWEIAEGVIKHQSRRIEELTAALSVERRRVTQLMQGGSALHDEGM